MEHHQSLIFDRKSLIELFEKIDAELTTNATLYVMGGAAASIAYESKLGTKDIDIWTSEEVIKKAYETVIKKYPELNIPLETVTVQIPSTAMKNRFAKTDKINLKKLTLLIPEPEDLFLLKAQRADEKDIDDLIELSTKVSLSEELLLKRFQQDILPNNYASDHNLIGNYLYCIDKVFKTNKAEDHEKAIFKN